MKGSHRWPEHNPITSDERARPLPGYKLPLLPDISALATRGEIELLAWDVNPGDVLVFNSKTVHGSAGNMSASMRRRAWAFRFVGREHGMVDWTPERAYPWVWAISVGFYDGCCWFVEQVA